MHQESRAKAQCPGQAGENEEASPDALPPEEPRTGPY